MANSPQGEQLESVHQHRERAKAAYDLVDYYNQFSRDEVSRLDSLKKEGKEGRRQVAVILRRLVIVAKEVDLPYAEKVTQSPLRICSFSDNWRIQTREVIDKYCETFEKEILSLFDRAYRKGDPKMMHVRVGVLSPSILFSPSPPLCSTVRRPFKILMEDHPAFRYTSTNMTSSSTECNITRSITMTLCLYALVASCPRAYGSCLDGMHCLTRMLQHPRARPASPNSSRRFVRLLGRRLK